MRRLAYDGKGNYVVHNEGELADAVTALGGFETGLYAEAWVPYVKARPRCQQPSARCMLRVLCMTVHSAKDAVPPHCAACKVQPASVTGSELDARMQSSAAGAGNAQKGKVPLPARQYADPPNRAIGAQYNAWSRIA